MITKLSHVTIFVIDQEAAYDFYVNKLGFNVHTDAKMDGGFRWLTVTAPAQPDLEIALMPTSPGPMMDEATSAALQDLIRNGKLGAGVFDCDDCQRTYDELMSKGVEFTQPPTERFYGIEALLKDNSGNWFSMSQHKDGQ
ncbi:MAG: VOC family protein [Fimbriimonas sp.]|nr:VOC family protein [Fimbriimonas sp.]